MTDIPCHIKIQMTASAAEDSRTRYSRIRFFRAMDASGRSFAGAPERNREKNMRYQWLDEYLMKKKGVTKDFKEEWQWTRYLLGEKMFTAVCLDQTGKEALITLKLEPAYGDYLRGQFEDITPGYYMNKVHWNSVAADGEVPDELLRELLDQSYQLVLGSLSKKKQKELLGEME